MENYLTIQLFNDSNILLKAEEVFGYGDYVDLFEFETSFIILYSYADYYIEIIHDVDQNTILNINAVSIDEAIFKYRDVINLYDEIKELA